MKYTKLISSLFFAGLLLSGCGSSGGGNSSAQTGSSSAATTHQTTVVTTNGEIIPVKVTTEGFIFGGYEGKPVVLEFYGDTCPHCINAIPMYNNFQAKYGSEILILTIESYGNLNNAGLQGYAASKNIQYRTVSKENSGNIKAYAEGLVGPMAGVPYVIVINKNGVISSRKLVPSEAQLQADILDVL